MKKKIKKIDISITPTKFTSLFNRLRGEKSNIESREIIDLRSLLSNEKAKILYAIKYNKPNSIYHLSKILKRDFKSVREDLIVLEKFGFIEFKKELKGNRKCLKPILIIDSLQINFEV